MKKYLAILVAIIPSVAFAQNSVRQNGSVTKFDIPAWIQDHTLESGSKTFQDNARGFNPFNVYDAGTDGITLEDALANGAHHKFSFGHNAAGDAIITVAPVNGAPNKSLFLNKNGTIYEFPFSTSGIGGPVTTVVGDAVCWNNTVGTLVSDCGIVPGNVIGPNSSIDNNVATYNGITGKVIKDSGFSVSAITANGKTVSSSYTVVNADNHTVLNLNSTGAPNQTVTVGTLSSYTDVKFTVSICNRDSRPWKIIAADSRAGTLKLYPNQCNILYPDNAGQLVYWAKFRRNVVNGNLTLFMGPAGACDDNNDGFTSAATGALCNHSVANRIAHGEMECVSGGINISVLAGSYSQRFADAGPPPPGCGDQITVTGAGSSSTILTCPPGSLCFDVQDHAIMTVSGFTVICTNSIGFSSRQYSVLDVLDVITGNCTGGTIFIADDGHMNFSDPLHPVSIQGSAIVGLSVTGGAGLISASAGTLQVTTNPISVTYFVQTSRQGRIEFGPAQIVGGGAVTGTKWTADELSLIHTSSGVACDSYFNNVGTINGAATNGAVCK